MIPHLLTDLEIWGNLKFPSPHQKDGHMLVRREAETNHLCPRGPHLWFSCKTSFNNRHTGGWMRNVWEALSGYDTASDRHIFYLLLKLWLQRIRVLVSDVHMSVLFQQNMCFFQLFQWVLSMLPDLEVAPFPAVKKLHIFWKKKQGRAVTWLLQNEVGGWPHSVGLPGARGGASITFGHWVCPACRIQELWNFLMPRRGMSKGMAVWSTPPSPYQADLDKKSSIISSGYWVRSRRGELKSVYSAWTLLWTFPPSMWHLKE